MIKSTLVTLILLIFTGICTAQTGPGGIGTTDGLSSLKIWLRADNGLVVTGAVVDSIRNSAGLSALSVGEAGSQRPTLVTGAVNGYNEISFSGSNRLRTGLTLTTTNFVVDEASSFVVCRADNTTQMSCVYTTDPLVGTTRFTNHIPWAGTVYYDIGTCCATTARLEVGGLAGLTSYSVWSYDALPATGKQMYRNGALLQNRAATTTYSSHSTQRFNMGGNTSGTAGFQGDVTEIVVFRQKINTAQRIIIENYLAAKYGITTAANDLYNEDDPGAGNFDHDVAGIGRVDASNLHSDARGTGIVHILNPSGLGNDEFFIWGHNNGVLEAIEFTDVPAPVEARFDRVWRVSESSAAGTAVDVGSVDIRWDLNGLGYVDPSHLRLLVDEDNDGFFADETPIGGAVDLGGGIYAFNGVSAIQNNFRFTLSTINNGITILPIELTFFKAQPEANCKVKLCWETASERQNDYFTVQKSVNGFDWHTIGVVNGQGNSTENVHYEMWDESPQNGLNYYRLLQTDWDGKWQIHKTITSQTVDCNLPEIFPNPATSTVIIKGIEVAFEELAFYDLCGKCVSGEVKLINQSFNELELDISELAQGSYLITMPNGHCYRLVKVE